MSFGFSVGDFVAVGTLIAKCIDVLRNTPSEYRELIRELESLKGALSQVDKLKGRGDQAIAIDQIKCAALTCMCPLEQFLAKIQKFDKSLGLGKSVGKVRDAGRKIQFALGRKEEALRLRSYLNVHIGTINTLLLQNGLERLDVASEQSQKNQEETKNGIEGCSTELKEMKGNVEAQILAVRENNSMIQKLFGMLSGEIAAPLKTLTQTVAKVCVSTQQIYTIVLELKTNVLGIDTRFTYFQAPVTVEDALGRVFRFSSECGIEALDAEIRSRFKKGPGKIEVIAGDFELFNAKNAKQVLTVSDGNGLLPGMSIYMAIVLEKEFAEGDKCPMPRCTSKTFVEAVGGGRTCSGCDVWFDKATKKRKRGFEREERSKHVEMMADSRKRQAESRKRENLAKIEHSDSEEEAINAFKRIRYTSREETREKLEKLQESSATVLAPLGNTQIPNIEAHSQQREAAAALLEDEEARKKQEQADEETRLEAELADMERKEQEAEARYAVKKKAKKEKAVRKEVVSELAADMETEKMKTVHGAPISSSKHKKELRISPSPSSPSEYPCLYPNGGHISSRAIDLKQAQPLAQIYQNDLPPTPASTQSVQIYQNDLPPTPASTQSMPQYTAPVLEAPYQPPLSLPPNNLPIGNQLFSPHVNGIHQYNDGMDWWKEDVKPEDYWSLMPSQKEPTSTDIQFIFIGDGR